MSWWVMEQVSVNDDGTQSLVNIQCDDISDLPSPDQTATAGYTIVRGSQAKVLATSENYILGGSGTWIKMEDGIKLDLTGYATEQYVDDGLAEKVDTSVYLSGQAAQDAALAVMIDRGSKNIVNLNTSFITHTNKGITYTNNDDGTINVSGTSNASDSYVTLYDVNGDNLFGIQKGETVVLKSSSNSVSINLIYKKSGGGYGLTIRGYMDTPATFTIPDDFSGFLLRIGVNVSGTTVNENVSAMICTSAEFAISPAIVPYAPTNRQLYEMILSLQGG